MCAAATGQFEENEFVLPLKLQNRTLQSQQDTAVVTVPSCTGSELLDRHMRAFAQKIHVLHKKYMCVQEEKKQRVASTSKNNRTTERSRTNGIVGCLDSGHRQEMETLYLPGVVPIRGGGAGGATTGRATAKPLV